MGRKSKTEKIESSLKNVLPSSGSTEIASYFATKLEAEWGPFDLKRALDANSRQIVILDTRAADAFSDEHIPEALNIPTAELVNRLQELPKDKQIVTYCWNITCHLATRAALLLAQNGYRVHELVGGIDRWKESGFDVSSSKKETVTNP